jgi:hypothetical protein
LKIDYNEHDGVILLASDKKRGIWANQLVSQTARTTRNAGSTSTSASTHSLLTISLASALRGISKGQALKLTKGENRKPRIVVTCDDKTFMPALEALRQNDKAAVALTPLRAGRNFLKMLAFNMARYELTFRELEAGDYTVASLRDWSIKSVVDPKSVDASNLILTPTASSQVVSVWNA